MKDWINRFLVKIDIIYGDSLVTLVYLFILAVFMLIMKKMGVY
jgi:hypothetical protein